MPIVFVGHGTPLSAIDPNVWTAQWGVIGKSLPRPKAILSISAHWLTRGASLVTAGAMPPMNYDVPRLSAGALRISLPGAGQSGGRP
jgi:4,5-DOPA dioxygenase extradiol